jgi:hypothetical protein
MMRVMGNERPTTHSKRAEWPKMELALIGVAARSDMGRSHVLRAANEPRGACRAVAR